jgi:hypothetical protein
MENYPLFKLRKELELLEAKLKSDIDVKGDFDEEISEDKEKVKQLKRSIAILESNKY